MKIEIEIQDAVRIVEIVPLPSTGPSQQLQCSIDGRSVDANVVEVAPGVYSVLIGGSSVETRVEPTLTGLRMIAGHKELVATIRDPRKWNRNRSAGLASEGRQQIVAPMPGKVVRLLVAAGEKVEAGQGILVVEAMKMQNEVRSAKPGTVERLLVKEGQTVSAGEPLAIVS